MFSGVEQYLHPGLGCYRSLVSCDNKNKVICTQKCTDNPDTRRLNLPNVKPLNKRSVTSHSVCVCVSFPVK